MTAIIRIMSRGFSNLTPTSFPTVMLSVESGVSTPCIMMEKVCIFHNVRIPHGPTPSFCMCLLKINFKLQVLGFQELG